MRTTIQEKRRGLHRQVALSAAIAQLRDHFGSAIIRPALDLLTVPPLDDRPLLSTGSLGIDLLVGGLPRGAISEYAGRDGSGRETLAAVALARAQMAGGLTVLVDTGDTADPDALTAAGIEVARLTLVYPATAAQAQAVVEVLCRCGALDLLLINSVSSLFLLPTLSLARRTDRLLARWQGALRARRTSVLLVNGPVAHDPWRTVGDPGLAQATTLRVAFLPRGIRVSAHGGVAELVTEARVIKHRGRPWEHAFELTVGLAGPDRGRELLSLARQYRCLTHSPLGLMVEEHLLGRSEDRAAMALNADVRLAAVVETRIRHAWAEGIRAPSLALAVHA
jgi:recA bacterial DNA recombination protein